VKNKQALELLRHVLETQGIRHSAWLEPDWANELTAIAIEPGEATQKLLSSLPLALKEYSRKEVKAA